MSVAKTLIALVAVGVCALAARGAFAGSGMTFVVTTTADSGPGSFRQAMEDANANPGLDRIEFNIPPATDPGCNAATGICSIVPLTYLTGVFDPVEIDGYSQPGAVPNSLPVKTGTNAQLKIELSGTLVGYYVDALVFLDGSSGSTLRGLVINSFFRGGVIVNGNNIMVQGNFIGTDASGTVPLGNGAGVVVYYRSDNVIGGPDPADTNLVADSLGAGIWIGGLTVADFGRRNLVQRNLIGTNADGEDGLGNHFYGLRMETASQNTIRDNIVASNEPGGIIAFDVSSDNLIENNIVRASHTSSLDGGNGIGFGSTAATFIPSGNQIVGNQVLGNKGYGVSTGLASDTVVSSNVVMGNGGPGIISREQVHATQNAVWANGGIGLDTYPFGVTPNDPEDLDEIQNFPDLALAESDGASLAIEGQLDSKPDTEFVLEFFANSVCDPSGHGEGEVYLGSHFVATGALGPTPFSVTLPVAVPLGHTITATAAGPDGSTSEFSACRAVCQPMDADCDDVLNDVDNCPAVANPEQENSDGDTPGDACDNCPTTTSESQANSDADPLGDACDNCPATPNAGQANSDSDPHGDACDNCPGAPNPGQENWDNDAFGDACDETGDIDCDTDATAVDALKILRYSAKLPVSQTEPCLDLGEMTPYGWMMGDVNCSGAVNSVDALILLRALTAQPISLPKGCPNVAGPPGE